MQNYIYLMKHFQISGGPFLEGAHTYAIFHPNGPHEQLGTHVAGPEAAWRTLNKRDHRTTLALPWMLADVGLSGFTPLATIITHAKYVCLGLLWTLLAHSVCCLTGTLPVYPKKKTKGIQMIQVNQYTATRRHPASLGYVVTSSHFVFIWLFLLKWSCFSC